jgi:hypothetical protein
MKCLSKFIVTFGVCLLVTVGSSMIAGAQTADSDKQALIQRFQQNNKTDHKAAYDAAKEFLQKYPNEASESAQYIKKWVAAYEKVSGAANGNSPIVNGGAFSADQKVEAARRKSLVMLTQKY